MGYLATAYRLVCQPADILRTGKSEVPCGSPKPWHSNETFIPSASSTSTGDACDVVRHVYMRFSSRTLCNTDSVRCSNRSEMIHD